MNSLIYLAYGLPDLINEGIYSILSYQRLVQHPTAQILVYTDQPAEFQHVLGEQPNIHYPVVSPEQWQAWRGSRVYLLKIEVLKHAAEHYPGNLLFVDTDTIWQQNPALVFEAIGRGQRYMHVCEGVLAQGNYLSQKIYRHHLRTRLRRNWTISIAWQLRTRTLLPPYVGLKQLPSYFIL